MVKVIFDKTACGKTDKNTTAVAYLKAFILRSVEIGGKDNQCLQFASNAFYKDVKDLKHATNAWL